MSTSWASGITATVTVEVWTRPWDSVSGTRWTRCTPLSNFIWLYTSVPDTMNTTSLNPPRPVGLESISSTFQPFCSAYRVYIRNRSPANRAASSPPAPARISMMMFFSSLGSLGSSSRVSFSS